MKQNGFTLIELLAVVVIIAIIATIGIFSVTKIMNESRRKALEDTALGIKRVAKMYSSENGVNYRILNVTPGSGEEAYLMELGKDPWGQPYNYAVAEIINEDSVEKINIYLNTDHGCYVLRDGATDIVLSESCDGFSAWEGNVASESAFKVGENPELQMADVRFITSADSWLSLGTRAVLDPSGIKGTVLEINDQLSDYETWFILPYALESNSTYDVIFDVRGDDQPHPELGMYGDFEGASFMPVRYSDFMVNTSASSSVGASNDTPILISGTISPSHPYGAYQPFDQNGWNLTGGQDWLTVSQRVYTGPGNDWNTFYVGSSQGNGNSYYLDNIKFVKVN